MSSPATNSEAEFLKRERQSIQPYVNWLQGIRLDPGLKLLKTTKGRGTKQDPCSVMTDRGQKPEDYANSLRLFAKVRKIAPARISFELVNCYTGLRYFGEADMNEETFPFSNTDITTAFNDVPNAWCDVEDFGKNCVLWSRGADYEFEERSTRTADDLEEQGEEEDEEDEDGDEEMADEDDDSDDGADKIKVVGGVKRAKASVPDDEEEDDDDDVVPGSPDERALVHNDTPTEPAQGPTATQKSTPSIRIEETPQYQELLAKVNILEREITSLNAQLIVEKVENSITQEALTKMASKKPSRFDITEYSPRKFISNSYNGRLYGVEHTSGKCHVLKEIINFEGELNNELKNITIANELALLDPMHQTVPENLLQIEEVQIEHTPLRKSHYFLSEPAAFSLEEFANTNLHNCDEVVPYIIGAQILSGLVYLKDKANRVHGNLSCNSVLVDFAGTIKLACFEFAFPIGSPLEPTFLLSDLSSVAYKHTQILESRDRAQQVHALPVMDIWSVGCIMFRLLNGGDLFVGPPTVEMRLSTAGRAYEPGVRECVGDLFMGYNDSVQPEAVLKKSVFAGLEKEKVTNHYKAPH